MKNLITCLVVTVLLGTAFASAETFNVYAMGNSFSPDSIIVAPGDTIRWIGVNNPPHTVTSGTSCKPDGLFHGELPDYDTSFYWDVPFDATDGEISYFCEPHCNAGMVGTITIFADCPADINGDGTVSVSDLLMLIGAWGDCDGCVEDIDGSGVVDVSDLLTVIAAWGPCE